MDEDFYIEETHPVKIVITIIIIALLVGAGVWYYYHHYAKNSITLKQVTTELGVELSKDIGDYVKGNTDNYTLDVSNVHVNEEGKTDSVGEYSYKITNGTDIKKGKIFVTDTTKPVVEVEGITAGVNEEVNPGDFVTKCEDLSKPCNVKFSDSDETKKYDSAGEYDLKIIISDHYGNSVKKDVKLKISATESLQSKRENDFEASYLSITDKEWNSTYTFKFDKCVKDDSKEYEEKVMEVSANEYTFEKEVTDQTLITIYNKYDYVIGFSMKIIFSDGTITYVTQ